MTLLSWFQQNIGKAVVVPNIVADELGQCWVSATSYLHDVYGLPYIYTPAAINVWNNSLLTQYGFTKIPTNERIIAGDLIFYDSRIGAPEGHVSTASQDGTLGDFYAYDSNWDKTHFHDSNGFPTLHEVHHNDRYNGYIVGYYRRMVGGRGAGDITKQEDFTMTEDEAKDLWRLGLHREPETDQTWRPWVGKRFSVGSDAFRGSQEWLTQNDILLRAYPVAMQGLTDLQAQLKTAEDKAAVQQIIERCTVDVTGIPADNLSLLQQIIAFFKRK